MDEYPVSYSELFNNRDERVMYGKHRIICNRKLIIRLESDIFILGIHYLGKPLKQFIGGKVNNLYFMGILTVANYVHKMLLLFKSGN